MAGDNDTTVTEVPETKTEDEPTPTPTISGKPLPEGKYTIIACDIDATGKRLIDEIVQVCAFAPSGSYAQYIMPLMNLNPAARQRHQVRVVNIGFFRMLKNMQTNKVMKTKTEFAALNDFLNYLEKKKADDKESEGIILLYHEQRKLIPYIIIEAMKKYNLLPRFLDTVKSFVNTYTIAVEKQGNSMKYFSLRQVAKALLNYDDSQNNKELFEGNASVRAKLIYEIAQHLACEDKKDEKAESTPEQLTEMLAKMSFDYARDINSLEIDGLQEQEKIQQRQSSLRPIFLNYFRTTLYHRVKAVTFRRILAEHGTDIDELQKLWTESKRDGFTTLLDKCAELKEQDRTELIEILDHHFDPEKQPVKPILRRASINRRRSRTRSSMTANGNVSMTNGYPQTKMVSGMQDASQQVSPRRYFRRRSNRINRRRIPLINA